MERHRRIIAAAATLLSVFWSGEVIASGLRCDGGLVNRGDPALVLERRCGVPDVREPVRTVVVDGSQVVEHFERWYYNRGPNQLIRIILLRNGRVEAFSTGSRGYREFPASSCNPRSLRPGLSRLELLGLCGEPESIETMPPYRLPRHGGRLDVEVLEPPREEWIYTFGLHRFSRIVTLVRGQVVRVETGPRLE